MPNNTPPDEAELITTVEAFNAALGRGSYIVISDTATDRNEDGPKYHHPGCYGVKLENFKRKYADRVAAGQQPTGRYWWAPTPKAARALGARPCGRSDDPV